MEHAIELGGPQAELYAELALQAVRRSGMWIRRYDPALLDGWVERALELSPEGSPSYLSALAAVALRTSDEDAARALQALGEQLDDPELRSHALAALTSAAWRSGDLDRVRRLVEARLDLLADISAPDDRHFALMQAIEVALVQGRLPAATHASSMLSEMVEGLTVHHRLHGVYMRLRVETLAGRWDAVRQLTSAAERAVEANSNTPCPGNVTSLLVCALAGAHGGDVSEARRLELEADSIGMEGFSEFDSPKLRLALLRNDLGDLGRLVDALGPVELAPYGFDSAGALLDALVALGDTARVEAEAQAWLLPGTYVEPFALRALGVVRKDTQLVAQAADCFAAMDLQWHAAETRKLTV